MEYVINRLKNKLLIYTMLLDKANQEWDALQLKDQIAMKGIYVLRDINQYKGRLLGINDALTVLRERKPPYVTGYRTDVIICDDPITPADLTDEQIEKMKKGFEYWCNVILPERK